MHPLAFAVPSLAQNALHTTSVRLIESQGFGGVLPDSAQGTQS